MKKTKFSKLSANLKKLIQTHPADKTQKATIDSLSTYVKSQSTPVSAFAERTLRHCNGGATYEAAIWLKNHLAQGGKLVITISGGLSSFQVGVMLAELIN